MYFHTQTAFCQHKVAGESINRSALGVIHSLMLQKYLYMAHLGFVGFRMQSPVYKCSPSSFCGLCDRRAVTNFPRACFYPSVDQPLSKAQSNMLKEREQ